MILSLTWAEIFKIFAQRSTLACDVLGHTQDLGKIDYYIVKPWPRTLSAQDPR